MKLRPYRCEWCNKVNVESHTIDEGYNPFGSDKYIRFYWTCKLDNKPVSTHDMCEQFEKVPNENYEVKNESS